MVPPRAPLGATRGGQHRDGAGPDPTGGPEGDRRVTGNRGVRPPGTARFRPPGPLAPAPPAGRRGAWAWEGGWAGGARSGARGRRRRRRARRRARARARRWAAGAGKAAAGAAAGAGAAGGEGAAGAPAKKGYVGIHSTGFKDFLLKPELLRAIVDCGFEHPSEGEGTP